MRSLWCSSNATYRPEHTLQVAKAEMTADEGQQSTLLTMQRSKDDAHQPKKAICKISHFESNLQLTLSVVLWHAAERRHRNWKVLCRSSSCRRCRQPQMSSTLLPQILWLFGLPGPGACAAAVMPATAPDPCRSAAPSAAVAPPAAGLLTAASPQSAARAPEKTPCVSAKYTRACSSTCAQQGSETAAAGSGRLTCQDQLTVLGTPQKDGSTTMPDHDTALTR
jgi:hypothetical protein